MRSLLALLFLTFSLSPLCLIVAAASPPTSPSSLLLPPPHVQVRARERHVSLPWAALRHHLDLIALVRRDGSRYARLAYDSGAFYVDEALRPMPSRPQ